MTNSNKVVSTKTYDPKKSTNVWNFKTPSTRKTKKANQPIKKMAAYLIFLFFKFIFPCNLSSDAPMEINEKHRHSAALIGTSPLHCHKKRGAGDRFSILSCPLSPATCGRLPVLLRASESRWASVAQKASGVALHR